MKYYYLQLNNVYLVVDCGYAYINSDSFDSDQYKITQQELLNPNNFKLLYEYCLLKLIKNSTTLKEFSCVFVPFNTHVDFVELN
jgi:hypothetical protein